MSYYPSNIGYIGVKSQGVQKTTAGTPNVFVKFLTDGSGPEFDEVVLEEGGDGKYDKTSVKTQHREKVSLSCYARPKVAENFYGFLLGKDTPAAMPTTLPTTLFKHTMIVKTTDLATTPMQKWMTLEKKIVGTNVHRAVGGKLSSISLEGEAGQPVKMTVEGTALTGVIRTTALTDTYATDKPYSFYHGTFHINAPTTSNFDIKSFTVKLNVENAEEIQTTALTRKDIINLKVRAEVDIALNYVDFVMFKKANYGAGTVPTETYSDGSLMITLHQGTGNAQRRLRLHIPLVRLKPHMIALDPAAKVLEQPLSGYGMKLATTGYVTVTAYNIIATTMPL